MNFALLVLPGGAQNAAIWALGDVNRCGGVEGLGGEVKEGRAEGGQRLEQKCERVKVDITFLQ